MNSPSPHQIQILFQRLAHYPDVQILCNNYLFACITFFESNCITSYVCFTTAFEDAKPKDKKCEDILSRKCPFWNGCQVSGGPDIMRAPRMAVCEATHACMLAFIGFLHFSQAWSVSIRKLSLSKVTETIEDFLQA